jgi:hypothetical protein
LSSTQEQTVRGRGPNDNEAGGELVLWAQDALQRLFTGPESDIHQMALSMEVEVSRRELADKPGLLEPVHADAFVDFHFLSEKDRQYIRTLVVMGYPEDAAMLVNKAYDRRCHEIDRHSGSSGHLFTLFDVEYLEMLVLVGQRKKAVDAVLALMDDYELATLGRIVQNMETQSVLEKEYRTTIKSIDETGFLPPESKKPIVVPRRRNFILRAIKALYPRRA